MLDVSLWYAIIGAVIGALIWEMLRHAIERIQERAAKHTGVWRGMIPQHGTEEAKEDLFEVRQKGSEIFGTISRQKPEKQRGRKWRFYGRIIHRDFIGAFWGDSYGVWFVRKPRDDDWTFEGSYLSIHDTLSPDGAVSGHLDLVPLKMTLISKSRWLTGSS